MESSLSQIETDTVSPPGEVAMFISGFFRCSNKHFKRNVKSCANFSQFLIYPFCIIFCKYVLPFVVRLIYPAILFERHCHASL